MPRFYLRRFADAQGQLRAYRRVEARNIERLSVENAAVEVGFYALDLDDVRTDEAEAPLSEIEGEVASSINATIRYWPLTPTHGAGYLGS